MSYEDSRGPGAAKSGKVMFQTSTARRIKGFVLTVVAASALTVVATDVPASAVLLAAPITSTPSFSAPSLVASGLSGPFGLRVRPAQNDLLVGEQVSGNSVIRIDLSTGAQTTFASFPGSNPRELAISPTGDVIVSGHVGSGFVARLTSAGMLLESSTVPFGSFAAGATFDTLGNLYVASAGGGVITKFTPVGGQLFAAPTLFASGFVVPVELGFDASGRMFVTDLGGGVGAGPQEAVYQVVPGAGLSIPWATARDLGATFGPFGLAVDPITGALFVSGFVDLTAAPGTGRIVQITAPHAVAEVASGFTMPTGLAFDPAGNLYVAEYNGGGAGQGNVWKLARPAAVDATPPTTTAKSSPAPNANGFNNTSVTVALSAVDSPNPPATGASGVNQIHFSASGTQTITPTVSPTAGHCTADGVAACTASLTISNEGTTTLSYFSTDNAGNTEDSHTLIIKIDKTPPEAVNTLNPTTLDVQVLGTDANAASVALTSVIPNEEGQLRTYTITDLAGNQLIFKEQVQRETGETTASIVSLQSCTATCGPVVTPTTNEKKIEVRTNPDGSKRIEQKFVVGAREIDAEFSGATNQTEIKTLVNDVQVSRFIRPGLVLLQLVTQNGTLSIVVPS